MLTPASLNIGALKPPQVAAFVLLSSWQPWDTRTAGLQHAHVRVGARIVTFVSGNSQ